MAIYTNYGRYLKARQLKEMLEEQGETYMLFGLGNPQWDVSSSEQGIPIAPYNTEIISKGDAATNQFYDNSACLYFNDKPSNTTINALKYGVLPSGSDANAVSNYLHACRRLIPPFPCIFNYADNDKVILKASDDPEGIGAHTVKQSNYHKFYIQKSSDVYLIKDITDNGDAGVQVSRPPSDSIEIQYFTEMYLRGKALENGISKPPVGLLGAVKCNVELVKDIGTEDDNVYTGAINQFWYGDRYWQTVNPDEDEAIDGTVVDDTDDPDSYIDVRDNVTNHQGIYPHHLIFTATVNPRVLCEELLIDQYLVPRQIAIFTRKRKATSIDAHGVIHYDSGAPFYRAYEHVFNFGQYADGTTAGDGMEMLNFTLHCKCNNPGATPSIWTTPNGEFKFLLNDYIRGQVRERHSIDRFGYVVGF